jgi:hypothetical protein
MTIMTIKQLISAALFSTAILTALPLAAVSALAQSPTLEDFIGAEPPLFDTPEAAVDAFRTTIAKDDMPEVAALLGLDAERLQAADGMADRMTRDPRGRSEADNRHGQRRPAHPQARIRGLALPVSTHQEREGREMGLRHGRGHRGDRQSAHRRERTPGHRDGASLRRSPARLCSSGS